MSRIRVLVVDDHLVFAEALCIALGLEEDLEPLPPVPTLEEAMKAVEAEQPDVVLLDHYMPDGTGVGSAAALRQRSPKSQILMLTTASEEELLLEAVAGGVVGFLQKKNALQGVAEAVRMAQRGETLVSSETLRRLLMRRREGWTQPGRGEASANLTPREQQVLELLGQGVSNDAIATSLGISPNTVRVHVQNMLQKLGARSRLEAVAVATRTGLIPSLGSAT